MGETIYQKAKRINKERNRILRDRKTCEYVKQGNDFLFKHGIKLNICFIAKMKHFDDDKEKRNCYEIMFSRDYGKKEFSLRFGDSLRDTELNIKPTAYDVLACLQKDSPGMFEDFCDEYGYNTDSIKDRRLYSRVVEEWNKVSSFFSKEEIEELREIQ